MFLCCEYSYVSSHTQSIKNRSKIQIFFCLFDLITYLYSTIPLNTLKQNKKIPGNLNKIPERRYCESIVNLNLK